MQAEPFEIITVDGKQKTFLFFQFHGVYLSRPDQENLVGLQRMLGEVNAVTLSRPGFHEK